MFDWPLDLFSLVIAIGAFILALKAFNRTDNLRTRLDALESAQATTAARPLPVPPPLPPLQDLEATLAADPTVAPQTATAGGAPLPARGVGPGDRRRDGPVLELL